MTEKGFSQSKGIARRHQKRFTKAKEYSALKLLRKFCIISFDISGKSPENSLEHAIVCKRFFLKRTFILTIHYLKSINSEKNNFH